MFFCPHAPSSDPSSSSLHSFWFEFFFFCLVFGFLLKTLEKDWSSTLPASLLRSWVINCTFFLKKKAQSQRKTFTSFTHLEPFRLWFRTETLTNHTNWGSVGLNQEAFRMTDVCRGEWSSKERKLVGQILFKFKLGLGGLSTVAATLADNQLRYLLYSKDVIGWRNVKNYWYMIGDWRWQLND